MRRLGAFTRVIPYREGKVIVIVRVVSVRISRFCAFLIYRAVYLRSNPAFGGLTYHIAVQIVKQRYNKENSLKADRRKNNAEKRLTVREQPQYSLRKIYLN